MTTKKTVAKSKTAARAKAAPELDARLIRERAVRSILEAAPAIIQGLIEKSIEGNHLPAKFVFDFAGLTGAPDDAEAAALAREMSLAELLLQRLEPAPGAEPAPASTQSLAACASPDANSAA
jgi:hypothetical protein